MEKKVINVNGYDVTVMEQPASYVLKLEKEIGRTRIVDYTKEILKYPSGVNESLENIIGVPESIKYQDLELKLDSKDGLYTMEKLFIAGLENVVFTGETFLKLLNKNIDDYKYQEIEKIGLEVWEQVKNIAFCGFVVDTFRRM
jgi:hypothetical protein|nr:MAG TPA: hypothetical protein [Caudoviricetes sp.]